MHDFEMVQHILQIVQIDKSHAIYTLLKQNKCKKTAVYTDVKGDM